MPRRFLQAIVVKRLTKLHHVTALGKVTRCNRLNDNDLLRLNCNSFARQTGHALIDNLLQFPKRAKFGSGKVGIVRGQRFCTRRSPMHNLVKLCKALVNESLGEVALKETTFSRDRLLAQDASWLTTSALFVRELASQLWAGGPIRAGRKSNSCQRPRY